MAAPGGEVDLNMEDHRNDDYVAPKVKVKAFSGSGQMLGRSAEYLSFRRYPEGLINAKVTNL